MDAMVSSTVFTRGQNVYDDFYTAMKTWGRFELVNTPSDADVVVQISFSIALGGGCVIKGDTVGAGYDPQLRLLISDPKTNIALWGKIEHLPIALLKSNRDKNLNEAMKTFIDDLKALTTAPKP
jgi:hypothetical protein